MVIPVRPSFEAAARTEILDRAQAYADEVRNILIVSKNMIRLLEAGAPVCATEIISTLDKAEAIHLVSRQGMKLSGLDFVVSEDAMKAKMFDITADDAMSTAYHIYLQARRTNNIINRKPGAYTAPAAGPLYGPNIDDWQPLIP